MSVSNEELFVRRDRDWGSVSVIRKDLGFQGSVIVDQGV